ncbi:hydrogenase subunit MbhD domain-containing protein [Marinimicrobium sp. ARAG 43.8]|uniref:hydrogenase subunit MbhD domain-containing protein n=1 Tax=Marinimicrobium sp. ARAG 43.8 TaxID=3418719 RepID=UPI003CEB7918
MAEWLLDIILGTLLIGVAIAALHARTLFTAVVTFIGFGLLAAFTWARLNAPDLALAEAAIGAGLTGVLLMNALRYSRPEHTHDAWNVRTLLATGLGIVLFGLLVYAVWPLATMDTSMTERVADALNSSGVSHPVTAVLLNFRAWDTLLELLVVLLALLGTRQVQLPALRLPPPWPLLLGWSQWLATISLLLGTYVLWRGADAPGGAFQAGALWAAGAIILRLNGFFPSLHWQRGLLRLSVLAGLSLFVLVAIGTAMIGPGWLNYPDGWAKPLILLIEIAATLSIAITLTLLAVADEKELRS